MVGPKKTKQLLHRARPTAKSFSRENNIRRYTRSNNFTV